MSTRVPPWHNRLIVDTVHGGKLNSDLYAAMVRQAHQGAQRERPVPCSSLGS